MNVVLTINGGTFILIDGNKVGNEYYCWGILNYEYRLDSSYFYNTMLFFFIFLTAHIIVINES